MDTDLDSVSLSSESIRLDVGGSVGRFQIQTAETSTKAVK